MNEFGNEYWYACYLIVQMLFLGKNRCFRSDLFAVQTRKYELTEKEYGMLTEAKLKKENISSEKEANETHYHIGKNIREVIVKNSGTMPEKLPAPKKSLKELEK